MLAAGAATRFGSPKQLLLLPHVLEHLREAAVEEIVIVAGAYPIEPGPALPLDAARVVTCPDWALGPGASLRCGLAALGADVEAALVVLADGPCARSAGDHAIARAPGRRRLPRREL